MSNSIRSRLSPRRRSQIFKRGYLFRKGSLVIQMFQQEQVRPLFEMAGLSSLH